MRLKLNDKIVVLAGTFTTWERDQKPVDAFHELIAAGIALIDNRNFSIEKEPEYFLIKPETCQVSNYCTQKTGISNDMVQKDGVTFKEFTECIQDEFETNARSWATFGDYTRTVVSRQARKKDIWDAQYPFSERHFNIKGFFALPFAQNADYNLTRSLEHLGQNFVGESTNPADIAYNTARLFASMLKSLRDNQQEVSKNLKAQLK